MSNDNGFKQLVKTKSIRIYREGRGGEGRGGEGRVYWVFLTQPSTAVVKAERVSRQPRKLLELS